MRCDSLRRVPGPDVYASAPPGWRTRLGSAMAARSRARRHARFVALMRPDATTRIVDVGCGPLGLRAFAYELDVTGVDLEDRPDYPGPFVRADATRRLPFEDDEFDVAFSNSLIEHLPPADRPAFAAELKRVARRWWVQTPAFGFPLEPHALLPAAHWLPPALRKPYWQLGVAGDWEEISLLRRSELAALFGEPVIAERRGPLPKSWIAVRA